MRMNGEVLVSGGKRRVQERQQKYRVSRIENRRSKIEKREVNVGMIRRHTVRMRSIKEGRPQRLNEGILPWTGGDDEVE
jgi:hypothetical protein